MIAEGEYPDEVAAPSGEVPGPPADDRAALARRMGQCEAIQGISAEITRELDLTRLLQLIIERALGLVGAPAGAICLWDEEHQVLIPQAWIGLGDWMGKLRVRPGEGAGGLAALRREGVLQNDCGTSPAVHPILVARAGVTAALAEPLLYRERLLGVLLATHTDAEHRFTADDQTVLRLFATQAAIALENARLFQEEQKRVEQLDTVRAVTTEVTRELDLSRLLRVITQRSIELLGGGSGAVMLWDEASQLLVPAAWHGHDEWYGAAHWRLGEGVVGTVAKRRDGMVVNDYRNSPFAHPLFLLRTEITAALAEPLLYRDQLLGVVTVDGYGEGRIFTGRDKQLLSLLASQAAIAIENARLYAAAEARSVELAALREIEQAIASHLDLPAVLEAVVAGTMRILDNSFAQIILWDDASQTLRFGAARGPEAERVKHQEFVLGRGINGLVAQTREPMILDNYQASAYAVPECADVVATISVPILFADRLLGVLHSHTTAAGRRFTPDDLRRLQSLATQAAFAIENARLHEATQKELADRIRAQEDLKQSEEHARQLARENATMAEIGRIINSTLNIEEVYQSFADEVRKIIAFDRIVINSINVEKNVVRNLYIAGEGVQRRNTADLYPLEGSGNAEMVRTRASLLIQTEDFQSYADRFPALASTFQAGFRSILNVPLFAKGQIIGGLLLRSRQLNAYTKEDVRLAERIGSQIAGAVASAQLYLENTRLYEEAQREIAERRQVEQVLAVRTQHLEAVRRVSEEIARELDLTVVLDRIVQGAVALVGAKSGSIRFWDESQQVLVPTTWTGSEKHSQSVPLRLGEGVAGTAAKQRRGLIVNDFRTSVFATPALLERSIHTAVMATPLLYGERLVGSLSITRDAGDPLFVEADLEALDLFAPHASTAIENARLHRATSERARQLATLTRLTQSLVAYTDPKAVGREVMAAVQSLMPQAAARLWDMKGDDLSTLELVASVGLQDSRGGTVRFRRGEGLAGVAVDSRRPVVSRDLSQDPRFVNKGWAAQENLVSAILFPLLVGERLHGILAILTREPHDFSETEVALLQSLASHAAIALENARLHASAVRRNTELEALLLSSKAIGSSLDLDHVLEAIVQQAAEISATPIVRLFLLEEDSQLLRCRVAVGFPLDEARQLVIPMGESLSGQVAATGEPLMVPDTREDPRTYYPAHVAQYGVVSYLGLPVKLQDRLLGVLVFNTPTPRAYSTDEITFLGAFAQQAALAIQNARLYETAVRQGAEREALLRATSSVMAGMNLQETLERIVQEASDIANTPHVKVLLVDKAAQVLRVAAAKGTATPVGFEFALGASLSGVVAQTGEPVFQADSSADPRNVFAQADRDLGIVTYLGLPIKKGGEVLGVLTFNTTAPRVFTPGEKAFLRSFADQAAVAIENARLHEATQKELAERIRAEEILKRYQALADRARDIVLFVRSDGRIFDANLAAVEAYGYSREALLALNIEDLLAPGTCALTPEQMAQADTAGILFETVNIRKDGSVFPVEVSSRGTTLGDERIRLSIIRDISERKQTEDRLTWELRVNQSLNALYAPLIDPSSSLENVLRTIVEQAKSLTDSEHGYVSSIDPVTGDSVGHTLTEMLKGECQLGGKQQRIISPRGPDGRYPSLWGHSLNTREPFFTNDPASHPATTGTPAGHVPLRRFLSVPVLLGDELVGQIALANSPRDYTQRDLQAICRVGEFYALAVQRRRTQEALGERTLQLEAVRAVSVETSQELNLGKVLRLIAQQACALTGAAAADIDLWDPERQLLVPEASYGHTAPRPRTTRRLGEGAMGTVAQTRRGMIINDYRSSPVAHPDTLAHTTITASLIEPLLYRDTLLGVIGVDHETPGRTFTTSHLALLNLFASQAAVAIENARLHEAVQRHAADLEARVSERTAALEEALRVKAEFLAKMSHELRTPLNFVLGFAELLKQGTGGALTPKQVNFVDRIVSGGKHLLDLVSDLLDMSLLEAGREGLQLEPIPLAPLVCEVMDLFGIQATQKRLELRQTVEPGLTVVAERRKLIQILSNLIANAVKFTPEGGTIMVTAGIAEGIADCQFPISNLPDKSQIGNHKSKMIEIAVTDTGIGLAHQDLGRIFRGFEQVDGSATRRHGGAGIGLALVRTLVELHGGQVWAESEGVGHGARFVVHFPLLEAPPPKRVLVVEDQIPLLKTLCVFLRDSGFVVEGAATGSEALATIQARRPDLVILDIGLPDIDGWEILRRVRADERTHDIRIVVLTGLGESEAEHALTLGANEFLAKPVSPVTLVGVARALLTGVPQHPGPGPSGTGA